MATAPDRHENELSSFLSFLGRRKGLIAAVAFPIGAASLLVALLLPNRFTSSISIFIDPQKVPADYVRPTVTTDIESRVRTIVQQLSSRTRLLQVMDELDLYPGGKAQGASRDRLVMRMASNLKVEVPNRREGDYFRVSFTHGDPAKAQKTVGRLVQLFVTESFTAREEQAAGTTLFIEEELATLKATLERQEAALKSFRQSNMGELPEQLEANLRMLDNLNLRLTANIESQRELENRAAFLEQDAGRIAGPETAATAPDGAATAGTSRTLLMARRDRLREQVSSLSASYTELHPDLAAARRELAQVEEAIARQPASAPPPPETVKELASLRRQTTDAKAKLAALQEEEDTLRRRISDYQRRVETAPRREQELAVLTRDYQNTKTSYEDLLAKRNEAQLSENLERRRKGEQFRVLDPANLPDSPTSPNRARLAGLGIMGGLGAGVGAAFLLEALFPAFYSVSRLRERLDLPVVMGIPRLRTPGERRRSIFRAGLATGTILLVLLLALLLVDRMVLPLPEVVSTIRANLGGMP